MLLREVAQFLRLELTPRKAHQRPVRGRVSDVAARVAKEKDLEVVLQGMAYENFAFQQTRNFGAAIRKRHSTPPFQVFRADTTKLGAKVRHTFVDFNEGVIDYCPIVVHQTSTRQHATLPVGASPHHFTVEPNIIFSFFQRRFYNECCWRRFCFGPFEVVRQLGFLAPLKSHHIVDGNSRGRLESIAALSLSCFLFIIQAAFVCKRTCGLGSLIFFGLECTRPFLECFDSFASPPSHFPSQ
mmetsp:Transcript_92360/g.183929  ORF Transcript_92360/g.183929 Transcript_92360/m.183929 type:complete len:241 (-) Transcript_92360:40-762(-)